MHAVPHNNDELPVVGETIVKDFAYGENRRSGGHYQRENRQECKPHGGSLYFTRALELFAKFSSSDG